MLTNSVRLSSLNWRTFAIFGAKSISRPEPVLTNPLVPLVDDVLTDRLRDVPRWAEQNHSFSMSIWFASFSIPATRALSGVAVMASTVRA